MATETLTTSSIIEDIGTSSSSSNSGELDESPRIYRLGEAILAQRCAEVNVDRIKAGDAELLQASVVAHRALSDFRKKNGFGRAIAAPQVGFAVRMIALHIWGKSMTIYNPVITSRSADTFMMWDDCLSFPDLMCSVRRYVSISISFVDEDGQACDWKDITQDVSELLQHEIDHLDGVLAVNVAVAPERDGIVLSDAIVKREEWLQNQAKYVSYVDYHIA